jgi:predicted TIM-barrel fold metal-dependent hydrolase
MGSNATSLGRAFLAKRRAFLPKNACPPQGSGARHRGGDGSLATIRLARVGGKGHASGQRRRSMRAAQNLETLWLLRFNEIREATMLTRRGILLASIAAGVAMNSRDVLGNAAQPSTPVKFDVPAGACDCHTHIHADPEKFPFFAGRVYTPEPASPQEMSELHKALGIERVVIVTPSVYGPDNSATQFGMRARGATARGVAVIDEKTPESDLDAMHKDGFRGIRLNLATSGVSDPNVAKQRFQGAVDRMKARGWHVQLYTTLPLIAAIKEQVLASPVPAVFDHFGGADAALGVEQPGFSDLVDLVKSGKAYVKISGAYRASKQAPDYGDVVPLAKMLIAANPDRIVWGTDWPHPNSVTPPGKKITDVTPLFQIDDGAVLNQLAVWAPDAAIRKKILVDNPARLYGFG